MRIANSRAIFDAVNRSRLIITSAFNHCHIPMMFVFPAYNSSYKSRKRTFRCCQTCRMKRIRCFLTGEYETHGCDVCRRKGLHCDLIKQQHDKISVEQKASFLPDFKLETPVSLPHSSRISEAPMSSQSSPNRSSYMDPIRYSTGNVPPLPKENMSPSRSKSEDLSTYTNQTHSIPPQPQQPQAFYPNILASSGSPMQHEKLFDTLFANPFAPVQEENQEIKSEARDGPRSNTSLSTSWFSSPRTFNSDNIEEIIHKVDWKFLKRVFDFNTSIKETAVYFAKTLSRKDAETKWESLTEILSKRHRHKTRYLSSRNCLHFKFLLSIHAFTLNTPGFFEVSQSDLLKLYEIYFYKVNSIFPIVHEQEFWELYKKNKIPNIMAYAMIIIAARDELSELILRRSFCTNTGLFKDKQNRFIYELEVKVRQLLLFLPELGDTEKLTRLTTQLLLCLNFTFNKFGNEQSSHDLFDCVSYSFSLLIHHDFFHERIIQEGVKNKSTYLKHLWWVIFILDRFNALLNGKAVVIKRPDFNIGRPTDLPHLDRIVGIAYALEDTLIEAFRPPRVFNGVKSIKAETLPGDPIFVPSEYLKDDGAARIEKVRAKFMEHDYDKSKKIGCLPAMPVSAYRDRHVLFLEEIMKNQIGLILRTGQVKYLKSCPEIDEPSLRLSESFVKLLDMLKDGRGYELVMPIPLIPLIMLVSFSVPLTSRMRLLSKLKGIPSDSLAYAKMTRVGDLCNKFIQELNILSESWWFVHEVMASIQSLNQKANKSMENREKILAIRKAAKADEEIKRHKLSIKSLVSSKSDDESAIPLMLSITSPGFYDEVIVLSGDEDQEEKDADSPSTDDQDEQYAFQDHLLVPPVIGSASFTNYADTDEAPDVRGLLLGLENAHPFSDNPFQFANEGMPWDAGFVAGHINDETSFLPNILHFFNEQPMSM